MTLYKRVAIFFAPESQTPLANFGTKWLGWDVENAFEVPHIEIAGLPVSVAQMVAAPKKYGFHGTLKAPFKLQKHRSIDELRAAITDFSVQNSQFTIGKMKVARLGNFVAIIQESPSNELRDFALNVVRNFEDFRAPLNDEDIAKRRKTNLTPRQDELMLKWGYPFVYEEFKFHLTLTGKLSEPDAVAVQNILSKHLKKTLEEPLVVVDLCLYGEREDGRFEIIERFPFRGR